MPNTGDGSRYFYNMTALRTYEEVAQIMTARGEPMSRQNVEQAEKRALRKLHKAAGLKEFWTEFLAEG